MSDNPLYGRRRAVKKLPLLLVSVLLCVMSTSALQQRPKMPTPPPSLDQGNPPPASDQTNLSRRIDLVQLQKEADDLARTAQTIPSDVASVRKGMLPKDVVQKLKQIEKLSKHLRSELNR
jgi:hypothetical protein